MRNVLTFLVTPSDFDENDVEKHPLLFRDVAAAQIELFEFKEDTRILLYLQGDQIHCIEAWKHVSAQKYPNLKLAAIKLVSIFGSTYRYRCESAFSHLWFIRN